MKKSDSKWFKIIKREREEEGRRETDRQRERGRDGGREGETEGGREREGEGERKPSPAAENSRKSIRASLSSDTAVHGSSLPPAGLLFGGVSGLVSLR